MKLFTFAQIIGFTPRGEVNLSKSLPFLARKFELLTNNKVCPKYRQLLSLLAILHHPLLFKILSLGINVHKKMNALQIDKVTNTSFEWTIIY